jgi:hypothetical protein
MNSTREHGLGPKDHDMPLLPRTLPIALLLLATATIAATPLPTGSRAPERVEPPASPTIPPEIFTKTAGKDPKGVTATMRSAKKGDRVVVEAKIGGRVEPFVGNRAVFVIADLSLKSCDQTDDDACRFPWDYCCVPAEDKKTGLATVEIVGDDGKPIRTGAKGAGGLEPLARIVVEGTVRAVDPEGQLVLRAERIHVVPKKKSEASNDAGAGEGGTPRGKVAP